MVEAAVEAVTGPRVVEGSVCVPLDSLCVRVYGFETL